MTSRKELELKRRENLNRLEIGYRSNVNRIEYSPSESIEHFMAKVICFVLLRNGIPANRLQWHWDEHIAYRISPSELCEMFEEAVKQDGQKFKEDWRRPMIVIEGRMKDGSRHDIFCLDTGQTVEIVSSSSPKKRLNENRIEVII